MQNSLKNSILIPLLVAFLVVSTGFSSIFKKELSKTISQNTSANSPKTEENQQKSNKNQTKTPVFEEKTFDAVASATQINTQEIYFKYISNAVCYSSFIYPQNLKCWQWKGFLACYYQCVFENFVVTNAP